MALKCSLRIFLIITVPILIVPYGVPLEIAAKHNTIQVYIEPSIQIDNLFGIPHVTVTCFDYESLEILNLSHFDELKSNTVRGIYITFNDCFNNETHHKNYQHFGLYNAISEVQSYVNCDNIEIRFDEYGIVDGGIFFGELELARYQHIEISSIGFTNRSFFDNMQMGQIILRNTGHINFGDFSINAITTFHSEANTITNFTKFNLTKFRAIKILKICEFAVHDYGMLDIPNLFEQNIFLETIGFENLISGSEIVLNEALFNGLHRLTFLDLKGIHLEKIPVNLFSDLPVLENVNLENNNLHFLDRNTFINNRALSRLKLGGNNLFKSQHLHLHLSGVRVTLDIVKSEISNFNSILSLIENPSIQFMNLNESNLQNFELSDFDQIRHRSTPIHIVMSDTAMNLSISHLRAKSIRYELLSDLSAHHNQKLNAVFYITANDSNLCRECYFVRDTFRYYLDAGLLDGVSIYLRNSKVMIKILMRCTNLENYYEHPFKHNCPPQCECIFNPLLDKVLINCRDRGLRTIPKLLYPAQFTKIDSIDLDISKNYLTTVNFDDQDDDVLKVLSTFDLTNNEIKSIRFKKKAPSVIHHIRLCGNTFLNNENIVISLNINERWNNVTKQHCQLGTSYPGDVANYILKKPLEEIYFILDKVRCD